MYYKAIDFDNLYKALKKSCRNVRWKDSVTGYESNALVNTYKLRRSLLDGKYTLDKYQHFRIYEPKQRDIIATRIKDRQLQRSICDNGFYDAMTKSFITDNCACQIARGPDYAIERMRKHLNRYYINHGRDGWVLKCDIFHYFPSIRHDVAKAAVGKRVLNEKVVLRVNEVIDSFGEIGLGLGSQLSQLVALAVLDDLDHHIKERLHIKYYLRYMDDFILVHKSKEHLQYCREVIENKLAEIGLKLNKKTTLHPLRQGIRMLQLRFALTETGKVKIYLSKQTWSRWRRKLKKLSTKEMKGECRSGTAWQVLLSYRAYASRASNADSKIAGLHTIIKETMNNEYL